MCQEYPGSRERRPFEKYLRSHRIKPGFSIIAYHVSVQEAKGAGELRERMREFAADTQGADAATLKRQWKKMRKELKEHGSWAR